MSVEPAPGALPRIPLWAALISIFAVGILAVGCGGSATNSSDAPSDAYGEANPVAVVGDSITIELKNLQFSPQGIKVKAGTTVTWVNNDPVAHNVRQVESKFLSPDVMEQGATFSFTFTEPGRYRYQCTFHHPNMNGVVIVEEG